jgi:hypothetical protein
VLIQKCGRWALLRGESMILESLPKTFRILLVLIFLTGIKNVIGAAPGPETWLDEKKQAAPGSFRQAADDLWGAVETESKFAFEAGWGVTKKAPFNPMAMCGCLCGCVFTLGTSGLCGLLDYCCVGVEYDKFNLRDSDDSCDICLGLVFSPCEFYSPEYLKEDAKKRVRDRFFAKTSEVENIRSRFKNAINSAVLKPEEYSGDVDIFTIGPWVEDGAQQKRNCVPYKFHEIVSERHSGKRDLSAVPQQVMAFVNARGGWDPRKSSAFVIPTYQSDSFDRY